MAKARGNEAQRSLPGLDGPVTRGRDQSPVTLPMREVSAGTDKAWQLAPMGVGSGKAAFVARSICTRGEGPQASLFTMPTWVAREHGWLR